LREQDYKELNPYAANVLLARAWFQENYGGKYEEKFPPPELDAALFKILIHRNVFDLDRGPTDIRDLNNNGWDYHWEGWELSQALLQLGIDPPIDGWKFMKESTNPFNIRINRDSWACSGKLGWAFSGHQSMINKYFRNFLNFNIMEASDNFDIIRIGAISRELESTIGLNYEAIKALRRERLRKKFINEWMKNKSLDKNQSQKMSKF